MNHLVKFVAGLALVLILNACAQQDADESSTAISTETADEFVARANAELADLGREREAAEWVRATYITLDTAVIASAASEKYAKWHSNMVQQALQYEDQDLDAKTRRAIDLLKLGTSAPSPGDAAKRKELAEITTDIKGMYGAGKYCRSENNCISGSELEQLMADTRDYDELLEYWTGWRQIGVPMRDKYARFVDLANEGARELGYSDLGQMWRSNYDMSPAEFEQESTRLWDQVKPLYDELHCHVRAKLGEIYGGDKVPQGGPIPAHLLGNMWAQEWARDLRPDRAISRYRRHRCRLHTEDQKLFAAGNGPFSRELLRVPGHAAAAGDLLGALAVLRSREIEKSFVTRAPGESTAARTCASRCASSRPTMNCAPFITSSATAITRALTRISRGCFRAARTTASTRPSAIRLRFR